MWSHSLHHHLPWLNVVKIQRILCWHMKNSALFRMERMQHSLGLLVPCKQLIAADMKTLSYGIIVFN